jgi:hypothetical protein
VGESYGMHERRKSVQSLQWECSKERDHSKDQGIDGGWDQNGSWEDKLGGCGVESSGSG